MKKWKSVGEVFGGLPDPRRPQHKPVKFQPTLDDAIAESPWIREAIETGELKGKLKDDLLNHIMVRAERKYDIMSRGIYHTYIYFIADEQNRVKVGKAGNPQQRLRDLQVGNADTLVLLFYMESHPDFEKYLHRMFGKGLDSEEAWIRGEWFCLEDVIHTMYAIGY